MRKGLDYIFNWDVEKFFFSGKQRQIVATLSDGGDNALLILEYKKISSGHKMRGTPEKSSDKS